MHQPRQRKKRIFSPIWILPFVALCIGSWLLYTSFRDAGIDIHVHFANAKGITPGKTKVIFKGIPVGTVRAIAIDDDMEGVDLVIKMENRARPLLVKDTAFWIVKAEVSAGRVSGLETLLGGSYIAAQRGTATEKSTRFEGRSTPPPLGPATPGLRFTLESDTLYSLQRGSNIYTKNLQIGHIEDYTLQADGKILFHAYVQPQFTHLIKNGTRFWNSSGLSLTGNLRQGMTVNIQSLASLLYGGITCDTHPSLEHTASASENSHFTLYKDFEAAEYGINMTLQLTSGDGIVPGKTEVRYRGLRVGVVKDLTINQDSFHTVTANILLDPRAEVILRESTRFWVIKPVVGITGIDNLETLLGGNFITFKIGAGEFQHHFTEEPDPMPSQLVREGTTFSLEASNSGSLKVGAPVLYKQLKVGEIIDITLEPVTSNVRINIRIFAPYDTLVRSQTVFWNVSGVQIDGSLSYFKVNLASLQSMLAGGIAFTTPPHLAGAQVPPPVENQTFFLYDNYRSAVRANDRLLPEGLQLTILAETMPSLTIGSPILFTSVQVGEVIDFHLTPHSSKAAIKIFIEQKYAHLVHSGCRFYNVSGLQVRASLRGLEVEAGSLDSILSGGLAFLAEDQGVPAVDHQQFPLFESLTAASHADDIRLELTLSTASGITDQTRITCKGIPIGQIDKVELASDASTVHATAYVSPETANLFRTGSTLALVRPEVSLRGVRHLSSLLTGPTIAVHPGHGALQTSFHVQERPTSPREPLPGLNIILEASRLGSLSHGSPVYYRQVNIGRVTGFTLSPTSQSVWIRVNIMPEYRQLVYTGSKFWNASGVQISGGLFNGVQVNTESVETLVRGGIAMASPERSDLGSPARNGDHFPLAEKGKPEWLTWSPILPPHAAEHSATGENVPDKPPISGGEDTADAYL